MVPGHHGGGGVFLPAIDPDVLGKAPLGTVEVGMRSGLLRKIKAGVGAAALLQTTPPAGSRPGDDTDGSSGTWNEARRRRSGAFRLQDEGAAASRRHRPALGRRSGGVAPTASDVPTKAPPRRSERLRLPGEPPEATLGGGSAPGRRCGDVAGVMSAPQALRETSRGGVAFEPPAETRAVIP